MKKIIAIVLLLVMAFACVACSRNTTAKTPETKLYTYTIVNNTGKDVKNVYLADDNSTSKADVTYAGKGMEAGGKASLSISAVPDKDGNPNLTASYLLGETTYQCKVTLPEAEIKLTAEGPESGAFDITLPQK
jgi:hypothetical protein